MPPRSDHARSGGPRTVSSPGGTTEAALLKFADTGFSAIVTDAVHAAA
jgi:pyrroline-5-carboxylate reductase